MFITKTHLPRRTVLRGMGTALALPFLDAMVPRPDRAQPHRGGSGAPGGVVLRAQRDVHAPLGPQEGGARCPASCR